LGWVFLVIFSSQHASQLWCMLFKTCKCHFGYVSAGALSCPKRGSLQNVALARERRPRAGIWLGFRRL